ncbi:glycosyltransferase family 2 protein [Streptomyces sp. NPDC054949]
MNPPHTTPRETSPTDAPTVGVVILTMGDRDKELRALLHSVTAQEGDPATVVVLAQGVELPVLPVLPEHVAVVELPENLGIPGGRNAGVRWLREHGGVDIVLVLDDDGLLPRTDTLRLVREAFTANPRLGIVGFRIADENGRSQRRHVPRLRGADPLRSGPVTTYLGGAHAIRARVIDEVGEFPTPFFYAHEETDFAWRALDAGWEIDYRADLVLHHPRTPAARHAVYYRNTARNRVWLAKRHLPAVLVPIYLASWAAYTLAQRPPLTGLKSWWAGFFEGVRTACPPRRPMRWRTVWRMTRLGRPPVI